MAQNVETALNQLKSLGSVADLTAAAAKGLKPSTRPKVNVHIHLPPNFSAFETVAQAVDLAADEGMGVVGVGNYYDYNVYADFVELAFKKGIFPIFGLEIISLIDELVKAGVKINDPGNPGKMYICGKAITRFGTMTAKANELLSLIRNNDRARMAEMIDKLAAIFSANGVQTHLTEAAVIDRVQKRHNCVRDRITLQERHIAQAFQEVFFECVAEPQRSALLDKIFGTATKSAPTDAVKIQGDIRSYLMKAGKPGFVAETFVNFDQAKLLILELGGIPCYPTLADGTNPICAYESPIDTLIQNTRARGVHCAEFIPIRNTPDVLSAYVKAMRAAGLLVMAGTEHNTLDVIPLDPKCVGGVAVPDDVQEIFWEGACVAAAHQFLTLHGQCGFVDAAGNLNPKYACADECIRELAKLGAALIATYQGKAGK